MKNLHFGFIPNQILIFILLKIYHDFGMVCIVTLVYNLYNKMEAKGEEETGWSI